MLCSNTVSYIMLISVIIHSAITFLTLYVAHVVNLQQFCYIVLIILNSCTVSAGDSSFCSCQWISNFCCWRHNDFAIKTSFTNMNKKAAVAMQFQGILRCSTIQCMATVTCSTPDGTRARLWSIRLIVAELMVSQCCLLWKRILKYLADFFIKHLNTTGNVWQNLAYSPLGAIVWPPANTYETH